MELGPHPLDAPAILPELGGKKVLYSEVKLTVSCSICIVKTILWAPLFSVISVEKQINICYAGITLSLVYKISNIKVVQLTTQQINQSYSTAIALNAFDPSYVLSSWLG